jgi:hypothetical protein
MASPSVKSFNGLNNVADPVKLGLEWLGTADNVDITQTGSIRRRDGYSQSLAGTITGAYSTQDYSRLYLVDSGSLKSINADMSTTVLKAGLSSAPMHWTEANDRVYFTNGIDSGIILPDHSTIDWSWPTPGTPDLYAVGGDLPAGIYQVVCTYLLPDGRETGAGDVSLIELDAGESIQIENIPQVDGLLTQVYIAPADSTVFQLAFSTDLESASWNASPDQLGVDLVTQDLYPLPADGELPTFWRSRMYVVQYFPSEDISAIWFSEPLGYHLFNLQQSFISVPGKTVLLAPTPGGMVIGTDKKIFGYDGETLSELANYGAVAGWGSAIDDDKRVLFWSQRGLCAALPFSNMTQRQVSVAPGISAGGAILEKDGEKQYVVALQMGGEIFNKRSES